MKSVLLKGRPKLKGVNGHGIWPGKRVIGVGYGVFQCIAILVFRKIFFLSSIPSIQDDEA